MYVRPSDSYMCQYTYHHGSENGSSPGRRQATIWNNAGIIVNWTLWTNLSENLI